MNRSEYQEFLQQLNDNFITGEYGFESSKGTVILQNKRAIITLCSLLFSVDEDLMFKMMRTAEAEIAALINLIMKESLGIKDEEIEAAKEDAIVKQSEEVK